MDFLYISHIWNDPVWFSRAGSIGVCIAIIYARRRLLAVSAINRKIDFVWSDFGASLQRAAERITPGIGKVFSDVRIPDDKKKEIIANLQNAADKESYFYESSLAILASLIWGYGDILVPILGLTRQAN